MCKAQINFLAVQSLTVFVVSNKIATSQILYDARRSGRPNIDTISVFFLHARQNEDCFICPTPLWSYIMSVTKTGMKVLLIDAIIMHTLKDLINLREK